MEIVEGYIKVWDWPVRLCHWLLVILFVGLYISGKSSGLLLVWHGELGLMALTVLVFRIVWGFVGTHYARFSQFFPSPKRLQRYYSSKKPVVGHSPIAAIAVLLMLGLLSLQGITGLFSSNDEIDYSGPLYQLVSSETNERMTSLHATNFELCLVMVIVHISAILYYKFVARRGLTKSMITGLQIGESDVDDRNFRLYDPYILLSLSIAVFTYAFIKLFEFYEIEEFLC